VLAGRPSPFLSLPPHSQHSQQLQETLAVAAVGFAVGKWEAGEEKGDPAVQVLEKGPELWDFAGAEVALGQQQLVDGHLSPTRINYI
jgi:hypothetical protein